MYTAVFWIRIRMDPGFFADPYPDLKNLDSDPSINKPKGCQWCFWLGFGVPGNLTKKESVESAKCEIYTILLVLTV